MRSLVLAALLAAVSLRCDPAPPAPERSASTDAQTPADAAPATDAHTPADATAPSTMTPLEADWVERLELPTGVVLVTPPVGAREPRPIVVAVHGAMSDPGTMCSTWRLIADVYPFVVCPGGTKAPNGAYVWGSSDAIARSVDAAVSAVRARYGAHVHPGPVLYVAFSQGANLAGPVLGSARKERRIARAVLTEGGYGAFDGPWAKAFASSPGPRPPQGPRVLLTCSQPGCAGSFERARAALTQAGASVRVSYSGPYGHSMPPPVRQSIRAALPWVVEGLEGWETYPESPKLP